MSIQMQCSGIILMLLLAYFFKRQRKLFLDTEKMFLRTFIVIFSCIVLDILSIVALEYRDILPKLLVKFLCKSYLVTLLGEAFCGLLYICIDIYTNKEYKKKVRKYKAAMLVGTLLIYLLPMGYHYAEDGTTVIYTDGASVMATYIFAVSFLIVNFVHMKKEKSRINPVRREAVQFWMSLWAGAALIQFFKSDLLLVGYMSAVGMVILYLKLENPETSLDRATGMFNHSALMLYIKQRMEKGQEVAVLALVAKNLVYAGECSPRERALRMEALEILLNLPDAVVFKSMEDEVVLVFENMDTAEKNVKEILQRFQTDFGDEKSIYVNYSLIYLPDAAVVNNAEDVLYLIHYIRRKRNETLENQLILADRARAEEMYREKEMERMLEAAMENDRVVVYYQPIFSVSENRFTSAEALVRIQDENGNIIPPGAFIALAEQNGSILRLGKIVFEKVCRMIKERDIRRYGLHYLEINLSVVQCAYERLAEEYIHIMKSYGTPPELINLEITESASLNAKAVLLNNMEKLIAYGVRFSLDDFGTGQSNLNYIVDMPVDIVKFDRSMTMAYFESTRAKYVMDHAINMIHGMNLEIVSEGIETEDQYQTMEELGIGYIQGYYFSKPLAEVDFWNFICRKNNFP